MKKKIAIISGVLALIIALGIGIFKTDASQASPRLNHEEIKDLVSAQYPGIITELELEKENNRAFYEIEIENDEVEYELLVDGDTGEILKLKEKRKLIDKKVAAKEKDDDKKETKVKENNDDDDRPTNTPSTKVESKEAKEQNNNGSQVQVKETPKKVVVKDDDDDDKPKQQPKKSSSTTEKQSNKQSQPKQTKKKNAVIDKNRAIQIALAEFPGKVEDVELDDDDGRLIYEIEIENGDQEAEIEIDAITGKIIMIDIDD